MPLYKKRPEMYPMEHESFPFFILCFEELFFIKKMPLSDVLHAIFSISKEIRS